MLQQQQVMSPTQENATDLYRVGRALNTRDTITGECTDPVKNISPYHCMTFFPLVTIR